MLKINEVDYAYASARIRAKEPKLLGAGHFDRMLDASHAEEAYKLLAEAEYGIGSSSTTGIFAFEELLAEEMKKCYSLLLEIAPQAEVIKAFQRRYDFFNIKVILKAEFSGQEIPPILMDTGTISKEAIVRMIRERDCSELTQIMCEAVGQTRDIFSRMHDPQAVDLILDRASYEQLATDLKGIDSEYLHNIAQITTDITNIKMFIRARTLNKAWDFIKKLLLEDGTIPEEVFFKNSDKPVDSFVEEIRYSRYGDTVYRGWEQFRIKRNSSAIEKKLDDYLMEFIRRAKMVTMGVEPLIAYLFAKEAEIRNVRIIMTGRINKLPVELIRERLREVYV